jgi:hypothetical protein
MSLQLEFSSSIPEVLISPQKIKIALLHSAKCCENLPPPSVLPQTIDFHDK